MCCCPITIKNPKKDFNLYKDQLYVTVPCGKCHECVKAKQLEWYTRAYFEYKSAVAAGGFCMYVTLTYNNFHLPKIGDIPVFSKRDIQLFLKRLRKFLEGAKIKYIVTCEYGGKTHRPHMHCLIFVYNKISPVLLKKAIRATWQNGFVSFGKYGGVVSGVGAISYTCKYICKDFDFDYENEDLKEARPFHLQSNGFGVSIMDEFDFWHPTKVEVYDLLRSGKIVIPDNREGFKAVFIPQYIKRKVTHNMSCRLDDRKVQFVENEVGLQLRKDTIAEKIYQTAENYRKLYSNIYAILYDEKRLDLFNKVCDTHFRTPSEVRFFIEGNEAEDLARYTVLYFDRVVLPVGVTCDTNVPIFSLFDEASIRYQLDVLFNPAYDNIIGCPKSSTVLFERCKQNLYNRAFVQDDLLISIYNGLSYVHGVETQKHFDTECEVYSRLKLAKNG